MKTRSSHRRVRQQQRRSFFGFDRPLAMPHRSRRLFLESLEERRVLATYNFDNAAGTLAITLAANEDLTISEAGGTRTLSIDTGIFTQAGADIASTGDATPTITFDNTRNVATSISVDNAGAGAGTNNVTFAGGTLTSATISVAAIQGGTTSVIDFTTALTTLAGNASLTSNIGPISDTTGSVSVTGTTTLNAGATGTITLDNPANNFVGAVSITATDPATLDDANSITFGALNVAGALVIDAGGAVTFSGNATAASLDVESDANGPAGDISNAAGVSLSVAGNAAFDSGSANINLGNQAGDSVNFGSLTFTSTGSVSISEDSDTLLSGASTAASLVLSSAGALTDDAAADLAVTGNVSLSGTSITLGDQAGNVVNFGSLTFNSAGAVAITEDSDTVLSGASTAASLVLTSSGTITDDATADLAVTNNASFTGTAVTLGDQAGNDVNFGSLTFNSAGAVAITEDSTTNLVGTSTADNLTLISSDAISSVGSSVTVTNNAVFQAAANIAFVVGGVLSVGGNASFSATTSIDVNSSTTANFGSLTFNAAGLVTIFEDSATVISGANTAGDLRLTSAGAISDAAGASVAVTGNASFTGTAITISAAATANFGSLTFISAGAVDITEDSATQISGANTAGSLVLTSAGGITDAAGTTVVVTTTAALSGTSISLTDNGADSFGVGGNASFTASGGGAIAIGAPGTADFGSLTFSTTGTVNITEDSSTALAGTSTGTAITLNSAGAITDAESDAADEIVGTDLILTAVSGIGTGPNPIHIAVTNLDVSNSTSGGIFVTDTAGGLTLTNLGGPNANAVNGVGGNGLIRAASPLTIAANAITSGGMTYTASDSVAAGDDLTVNSGVTVQDTTSTLTMNAGDNVIFNTTSVVRAATALAINGDALGGGVADPGVGSIISLFGTIQSDTAGITVTGNGDGDTITIDDNGAAALGSLDGVVVSSGQLFTINGNGGSDTLTLEDGSDTTGDTYTITATTISTGGGNLFSNAPGLNYSNLETINIQNSNGPADADGDVVTVTSLNTGTTYNVDGNDPTGLPGDTLILNPPGSINVYEIGGNYVFEFPGSGNLVATEFETIDLRPGNGILNIIGDEGQGQAGGANAGAGSDETDKITVVGTGIGAGTLQLSHLGVAIAIPPSVSFSGVTRLNVNTFDSADGLSITPYADNTPQGWGVETYYNEGAPVLDGDLLTYNGVLGVSENIVVQPSAAEAGQLFANNAATGTPIAVINYILNVNIIVNGSSPSGTVGDTDSLTLRGTDPANPGTSGQDTFVADFTATGAVGDEKVVVTDSVGGANLYSLQNFTNFSTISIESLGGADAITVTPVAGLTVNVDGGLPEAGAPGIPSDLLVVNTPAGASITQGANSTTGQVLTGGGVNFTAVEAVSLISGGGGELVVNATDDNDTIAAANLGANLVWVNDGPVIIFAGYTTLTLNGRFGNDDFSISPAGLTVATINVNGGDPTASDKVVVNGTAGSDAVNFTPTGADSATVTGLGPAINITSSEHVTYNGQGGNDALTYTGVDNSFVDFFLGLELDAGTLASNGNGNGIGLIDFDFQGVGLGGSLTVAAGGPLGLRLDVHGTADSDTITVTPAGVITIGHVPNNVQALPINTSGLLDLILDGHDGDDVFNIPGNHPFSLFSIHGGNPDSGSDVLNFTGTGGAVTVDLTASTVTEAGFAAVSFSGVETLNVNAGAGAITVVGRTIADAIAVTPTAANTARIVAADSNLTINTDNTGTLTVDTTGGNDLITVNGTEAADTITADGTSVTVNALKVVNYANTEELKVFGLAGVDVFNVTPSAATTMLINGGLPAAGAPGVPADVLNVAVLGITTITQGADATTGQILSGGGAVVNFAAVELVGLTSGDSGALIVNGTDDNDTIAAANLGANLVWVNDGPVIAFAGFSTLSLNGRFGSDDFNIAPSGIAVTSITVSGGDPTASDTVVVSGTAAADTITYSPTTADAGTVQVNAAPVVNLSTVEHLTINGLGGNDALTVNVFGGINTTQYTPGDTIDAGSVLAGSTLPLSFNNLGFGGNVTLANAAGRVGQLIYNGTDASDIVLVDAAGTINLRTTTGGTIIPLSLPVLTPAIAAVALKGLNGDDSFEIVGNHPFVGGVTVDGGDPSASDTLNFTGSGGAITIDLATRTITEAGFGPVSYIGVEHVNVDAAAAAVTVNGAAGNDQITVSHDAGLVTRFQRAGDNSLVSVSNLGASALTLDTLAGTDAVNVVGSAAADAVAVTYGTPTTVAVTGQQVLSLTSANLENLTLSTGAGNDAITLNGTANITTLVDAGDPNANDTLTYNVAASARVTQAAVSTNGKIDQTGGSDVDYIGVELLTMNSAAGGSTLTTRGTDDNDTIAVGLVGITAVWINDGTVIRYNGLTDLNFANVIVQGRFGDDSFSVTPHADVAITVQGGDPTASDSVLVNGTGGTDAIGVSVTGIDSGTVQVNALGLVTLQTVESLQINGRGGNDGLTVTTPAGLHVIELSDTSPLADVGSVAIREQIALGGRDLLPLSFLDLGSSGTLAFADISGARTDELTISARAGGSSEQFTVSSLGVVELSEFSSSLLNRQMLDVSTPGVIQLNLHSQAGDDAFVIPGDHPFTGGIFVAGGDPGASDVLNFNAAAAPVAAVALNLGTSTIAQTGFGAVTFSGIETINVDTNAQALAVTATASDDDLTVTVQTATSGKIEVGLAVQQNGQVDQGVVPPLINYFDLPASPANALAVDLAGGNDTLVVVGNSVAQNWAVDAVAGSVAIDDVPNGVGNDGLVTYTNAESLEVFGREGNDAFTVTPGLIPVFVDGGDPIGVLPGDSITVLGALGFFAGPESDEGGFLTDDETVSFDHIESIIVAPNGDCPFLILGTNADDDITVVARNEQVINGTTFYPGANGVQDFTVSVNAGPDILFLDEPDLFIDALNGDDDIVIRAPAPNDADWDVNVRVAGGPPSIGEANEGDRLVLETPGLDSIVFTATGPDTGNIVVDEDADLVYTEGSTDSIITFGPFVFECDDPVGLPIEFTYLSSPGGVELVEYDGELTDGVATDDITINGTALNDTTTVTPVGAGPGGSGQGSFVSPGSPLFNFRGFDNFTVNGGAGGVDTLVYNATAGADIITSDTDTVTLAGTDVNLGPDLDRFELYAFGGNDNIDINLTATPLFKKVDAGDGDDVVDLSGAVDADIFGGIGNDTLIGSPAADNIFGGAGNDIIVGGGGIDNEYGEDGNDRFGDLLLTGNGLADDAGADFMFGGDGIDQFIWEPGDGSDVIQGGVDGADILRFFGDLLANAFVLTPAPGAPTHMNTILGAATVDTHGVEQIIVSGLADADTFTVADLTPTEVADVILVVDTAGGSVDSVTVNGRTVSDTLAVTVTGARVNIVGLDYDVNIDGIVLADADTLTLNASGGNDSVVSSDDLNTLFASASVTINGGLGDDFVSGFGTLNGNEGDDTLAGGAFGQTIDGGIGDDVIRGGGGADLLVGDAGEDTFLHDLDGVADTYFGGTLAGVDTDFDTIVFRGGSSNDTMSANQTAATTLVTTRGAAVETDTLGLTAALTRTIDRVRLEGQSGDDIFFVTHLDSLGVGGATPDAVVFDVDGGAHFTGDRLSVQDNGTGDLMLYRKGELDSTGSITVGPGNAEGLDNFFSGVELVQPIAAAGGQVLVFKHDPNESNDDRINATHLGAGQTINVDPTIDPGPLLIVPPGFTPLPGDQDFYRLTPSTNGTLDIQVYFTVINTVTSGRPGLPNGGDLEIELYDSDGLPVAIAGTGTFGTNDADDNERIRIPAVAGQTYFLRVFGAGVAINNYTMTIVNEAAAIPIDLELDDVIATSSVAGGILFTLADQRFNGGAALSAVNDFYNGKDVYFTEGNLNGQRGRVVDYIGATRTFIFAANTFSTSLGVLAVNDDFQIESIDTGRSQFDNTTRDTTPTIFLRLPNVVNVGGVATLDDLPFNGQAPGDAPDEFIGIPFVPDLTLDATAPGFRVPVFVTENGTSDQGPPNNVLAGYAQPVDPVNRPGLFSFTFGSTGSFITSLAPDGSYFISARSEIIDPANPQQAQGYGDFAQSLEIIVDTQVPPVFFGLPTDPDDGLLPDSDSGLGTTNPETLTDRITNDTTPGFFGQAEADAVVRLFIDAPQAGFLTGNGIFEPGIDFQIGFDVADPFDGTNQFPTGFWQVDSITVDLNAAPFSPVDGLRRIFVTTEDVAGNINGAPFVPVVDVIEIFIDTQGPQITDVTINADNDPYNLFDPKPVTDGPTPLVNSIWIDIRDLPNRDLPLFAHPAFKQDIAENLGHYQLTGDFTGNIPILDVNAFFDPIVDGQPATGRVQLVFRTEGLDGVFNTSDDIGAALPDDRFTLFVSDEGIIDHAGNNLDGESNATQPLSSPPGPGQPAIKGVDGVPTGDGLVGGDFLARFTIDTRPELGVAAAGSAFLDINGNKIWDPDNLDATNRDISHMIGFVSDEIFSGQFARNIGGVLTNDGFDKLAAYGRVGNTNFRWLIDTDNDGVADIERPDPANINGLPVAGNFNLGRVGDEVGLFTGDRWHFDTNAVFGVDVSLPWPVAGLPIVGDFDGDGLDDLGTWTNDTFSFDLSSINSEAGGLPGNAGIDGTVEKSFKFGFIGPGERPVAADMNQDGIEDVGLWVPARDGITPRGQAEWYFLISGVTPNDTAPGVPANLGPTITGSADPTPGSYSVNPADYGLTNYTRGRIVADPQAPGTNVVRFQPVPFGNDQFMQFGDQFALPLVGNFDPPLTGASTNLTPGTNPRNQNDVNNDGNVNQLDLLSLINHLTVNGPGPAPSGGFVSAPFVDTNADNLVNALDLLAVINYLTNNPIAPQSGEGEGESNDEFFSELGSGSGQDDDDELLSMLAGG